MQPIRGNVMDGKDFTANIFVTLLGTSGATLSIVTSRLPRSTGSLAIFSGLLGKSDRLHLQIHTKSITVGF